LNKKSLLPLLALAAVILVAAGLRLWQLPNLPPGLWYDEAVNGVDAAMMLAGQGLPLYLPANGGREPLFIYLQTLSVALLGPSPFSLRLVSALIGIATVAAVYACGKAIFANAASDDEPENGARNQARSAALLAAAALAVTFWHVSISRLGLRAVLLPLVSALAMVAFWQGWTRRKPRAFAWAGFWFGLSLYTYTSARVLPFVPALFIATELLFARRRIDAVEWRGRWRGLGLALLVGAVVTIPMAVELARHPDLVLGRVGDVAVVASERGEGVLASAGRNAVLALRAFYDRGDANARHNLPGRAATDPLTALLFTAGVGYALLRLRDPRARLLLIWFAVMLLPSILSGEAPHYLRAAGALPPYALLVGFGGAALARLAPRSARSYVLPALAGLTLVVGGGLTARDYFGRWAADPALAAAFGAAEQEAAQEEAAGGSRLLAQALYRTPNMVFATGAIEERLAAGTRPAGEARWRLADGRGALEAELIDAGGAAIGPEVPLDLRFANGLRLIGYDAPAAPVDPSDALTLTLYWAADANVDAAALAPVEAFAHLVADGAIRATANGIFRENYRLVWPALRGLIVDQRAFALPADLPAGKVAFEVGLYTRRAGEPYAVAKRVPLVDANGNVGGDQVIVAPVMIGADAPAAETTRVIPADVVFGERIALAGWKFTRTADGEGATARLCWTARHRMPTDLTAFVHLIDAAGDILSQYDVAPGGLENPTSRWVPGETVCSEHPLTLPADATGTRLRVGLYEPIAGRQWGVSASGALPGRTYLILDPWTAP
jgi:4-amino-4-deoxy-L-arabinose transferase-like glycosyltransferase